LYKAHSDDNTLRDVGKTAITWKTATDATRQSQFEIYTNYRGGSVLSAVIVSPDLASVDGNARGVGAVDLQGERNNATEVASGLGAVISGGFTNTASGEASTVGGGSNNEASGASSTIPGGASNEASGANSFAAGNSSVADGDYSVVLGRAGNAATQDGVFIFADSTSGVAFSADRSDQFKVRCTGGSYFVSNTASVAAMEIEQNADAPVLELDQDDDDSPFIEYNGTSAADQTKNISTVNGDGAVDGPKNFSATAGWTYEGMVRASINGTDRWMPFYSEDTS
jgi:hypothetical protein